MTSVQNDEIRDVIIVGSGPAGYTAAIYTARANLNPLVIAGSVTAGGELMNTTDVENFPGFPQGIMGPDLMDNMQQQAERFGAEILFDDVTEMNLEGEIKTLSLADGTVYRARSIIVSTGSAYRELGLADEKRLSGHGVSWCATCDGFFFREQTIASELRASKIMADRALAHEKIEFVWDSEVVGINGEDKVNGLVVKNRNTGEESTLDVTGVFVAIGNDPRVDLVKDQLELTAEGTIAVDGRSSKTSLPGVFAAGDVIDSTYRQAITAAGSGCAAAQDVEHFLANVKTPAEAAN